MARFPLPRFHKVRIRLARHGTSNNPYYHLVLLHARKRRQALPRMWLGAYYPNCQTFEESEKYQRRLMLDVDRIKDCLAWGAEVTDPVRELLGYAGILPLTTKRDMRRRLPAIPSDEQVRHDKELEKQMVEKVTEQRSHEVKSTHMATFNGISDDQYNSLMRNVHAIVMNVRPETASEATEKKDDGGNNGSGAGTPPLETLTTEDGARGGGGSGLKPTAPTMAPLRNVEWDPKLVFAMARLEL